MAHLPKSFHSSVNGKAGAVNLPWRYSPRREPWCNRQIVSSRKPAVCLFVGSGCRVPGAHPHQQKARRAPADAEPQRRCASGSGSSRCDTFWRCRSAAAPAEGPSGSGNCHDHPAATLECDGILLSADLGNNRLAGPFPKFRRNTAGCRTERHTSCLRSFCGLRALNSFSGDTTQGALRPTAGPRRQMNRRATTAFAVGDACYC